MKAKLKNILYKFTAGFALFSILINMVGFYMSPPVYSISIDELCHPPDLKIITPIDGDDNKFNFQPWIELKWINRAQITMRVVGDPGCGGLFGPNQRFEDIVGGYMRDRNTADPTIEYRERSGDSDAEDSRVDKFDDDLDDKMNNRDNGRDDTVDSGKDHIVAEFDRDDRRYIENIEFVLSFEDSLVPEVTTCGANSNFAFGIRGGSGEIQWNCGRGDVGGIRGALVGPDIQGLSNFNISYNYIDGKIVHVSQDERNKRTFSRMEGATGDAPAGTYRSEDGSGDLWIDVTEAELDALGTGTGDFLYHKDGTDATFRVRIAGAENESAVNSDAAVEDDGGDGADDDCDAGFGLTWIICGTIRLSQDALTAAGTIIEDLLFTDPNLVKTGAAFDSWKGFRNLANVGLVLVFIVIIYSQATGGKQ